jgi:hypothetical protein
MVKTMCSDSYGPQQKAVELARRADVAILLDDGGGTAQSLFDICSRTSSQHRQRTESDP